MSDTPITESVQFRRGAMGPASKHSELVVHAYEMAKMEKERDQWKACSQELATQLRELDPGSFEKAIYALESFDKLNTP